MSQIFNYKFIVIGSPGVGKTSLIKNFVEGSFLSEYKSTIGTNLYTKTLEFKKDKSEDNESNESLDDNGSLDDDVDDILDEIGE